MERINRNALTHINEMRFLNENRKHMNHGEEKRSLAYVRKELEIETKAHELYVVVKDRAERCGE